MCEPLQLIEIRKTQRRVAALLQYHDADVYVPTPSQSKNQKVQLLQNLQVCSRLDPDGKYRSPALDYMRQGIQDATEYYHNDPLDDTDSGTEAPFNSPESTKLSLRKVSGDEDTLFQKSKSSHSFLDTESTKDWDHRDTVGQKFYKSENYSRRNYRGDSDTSGHLRVPRRQKRKRADYLREKISRSQEELQRHTGNSYAESIARSGNRDSVSEQSKRSVTLPPIDPDKRKSYSSESSRYSKNTNKSKLPSILQENDEPHLRYQHGIARKILPNDSLDISGEASHENMVHITKYSEREKLCKCGHPVLREGQGAKSVTSSRPPTCEICSQAVHTPKTASSVASSKYTVKSKKSKKSVEKVLSNDQSDILQDDQLVTSHNTVNNNQQETCNSIDGSDKEEKSSSTSQNSEVYFAKRSVKAKKQVMYTLDDGQLAVPGTPPSYMEKIYGIDKQLESGMFDYDARVDINDVDTTLNMSRATVTSRKNSTDSSGHNFQHKKFATHTLTLFPDGAREAYIKALAMAQVQKMHPHLDPWWLEKRLSRSYVFSYYQNMPRDNVACPDCGDIHPPAAMQHSVPVIPKGKEMKHILGNVNVNDYYPGMPKNPIKGITENMFKETKKKKKAKQSASSLERGSINSAKTGSGLNVDRQLSSMSIEFKQKMSNRDKML